VSIVKVAAVSAASVVRRCVAYLARVGRLWNRGRNKQSFFHAAPARRVLEKVPGTSLAHARRAFRKAPPEKPKRQCGDFRKGVRKRLSRVTSRLRVEDLRESVHFGSALRSRAREGPVGKPSRAVEGLRTLARPLSLSYDTTSACFGKREIMWVYAIWVRFYL
jgi:hypothetical protein